MCAKVSPSFGTTFVQNHVGKLEKLPLLLAGRTAVGWLFDTPKEGKIPKKNFPVLWHNSGLCLLSTPPSFEFPEYSMPSGYVSGGESKQSYRPFG